MLGCANSRHGQYLLSSWGQHDCFAFLFIYLFLSGRVIDWLIDLSKIVCFWNASCLFPYRTSLVGKLSTATSIYCSCIEDDIMISITVLLYLLCCGSLMHQYILSLWRMSLKVWHTRKRKNWETGVWTPIL
jgi:hypothetical protein